MVSVLEGEKLTLLFVCFDFLSAVREEKLKAKYEALKAEGGSRRVNKWIEKKRRKNAAKDRRRAPLESERD